MDTKHCRKCDTTKPVSEFHKKAEAKDGLSANCKSCKRLMKLDWLATNASRDRYSSLRWKKLNKERHVANLRKREVAKLHRTPAWLTSTDHEAIVAIYKDRDELTALTGIQFHVDHVIPLQGETVSGLHVPTNLAVIPYYENLSKSNQYDV